MNKKVQGFLALAGALLLSIAFPTANALASQIQFFAPQGEARNVRQVTARFSEPMVAFGDPRLVDPFNIRCFGDADRLKGRGRWVDARSWSFDFEADLPAGQRCQFTLRSGLTSLAGRPMAGAQDFNFNTGGPAVVASMPREGDESIDESQVFLLALDAPLAESTLQDAWCEAGGVNERIPLKRLSDKDTREILQANLESAYELFSVFRKDQPQLSMAQFRLDDPRWRNAPVVGVRCAQRLPAEAQVKLVLGTGVKTQTGIERKTPQTLEFKVRPAFLVKLRCQRMNKDAACLPVTPIALDFTAPVPRDVAERIRLKAADGTTWKPKLEEHISTVEQVRFEPPFPEKTTLTVELPRSFKDDAGREPKNKSAFPLLTAIDEYPPLVKFPARFGILELHANPLLPVTVRNVEPALAGRTLEPAANIPGRAARIDDEAAIIRRSQRFMRSAHREEAEKRLDRYPNEGEVPAIAATEKAERFEVPRANSGRDMEVIGIPLKKPGFYVVELASPRLGRALHGENKPYYVSTSVLVTNLAVHLKHGRERSIVWVTSLDRGQPVPDAQVRVRDCTGAVLFEGRTDGTGVADAGDRLPPRDSLRTCNGSTSALTAFARLGEDLSFTSSDWDQGIQPWNFNLRTAHGNAAALALHTVFDRTLFRAGETVHMKHLARTPTGKGFSVPGASELPDALELEHIGSGQKYPLPARFDGGGVAESTWSIPKEAKLGSYRLLWRGRSESDARFRVEAFRVPLMRAVLGQPNVPQVRPASVDVNAAVTYLSGGPAANLPVKVRSRVEPRALEFRDHGEFRFGGRPVTEGIEQGHAGELFGEFDPDEDRSAPEAKNSSTTVRSLSLDGTGTARVVLDKLPAVDRPVNLLVEMEYSDPNGEILAVAARVPLHPSAVYVGIKPEGWAGSRKAVRAQVVTLDASGKPLAGRDVAVDVYERKTYSHRRRLVGGFYAYDTTTETKKIGGGCSGTTDARGLVFCTIKPNASGELILVARARDDRGHASYATTSVWVQGEEDWWFAPADHDRIDLIPEKKRYEPGETARFQVRMPFRAATALITIEREGVLSHQVVHIDGKSPVIDVPLAGHHAPNVFVSALVLRGRVDPEVPGPYAWLKRIVYRIGEWLGLVDEVPVERDTRPTALVDLTKPAYKLGMAEVRVGGRDYTLDVKVTPARDVLKVRETVRVNVAAATPDGKPAAHGEVALAAVDEGLLELMDNGSWKILDAMLGERPVEVHTATAQGQVIGKRHFGRKAVAAGGGGGQGGARELFETLLVWRARVPLDAQGRATVDIPLNDSLSSFRIVAVAHAGADRFGHGSATVRTTQDLMLFAGLAPLVRENDEYRGLFTIRNATAQPVDTNVTWAMRDRPAHEANARTLASGQEKLAIAANGSHLLAVPVKAPVGLDSVHWEIGVAGPGGARDTLRSAQRVLEAHPVRVVQATLTRLDQPLELPVERPADAIAGRGGLRVDVLGSLGSELSAVREYFAKYPYTCLEQRTSQAIGLRDDRLWGTVAASLPNYLDRDGLARYFPVETLTGSDVLTTYLVQIASASGREWPAAAQTRMLNGLEAFVTGRTVRDSVLPAADLTVRKLAAIEALARYGRARPAMLDSITIDPALWPTSALIDWIGILQRAQGIPQQAEHLTNAMGLLRARVNLQGTTMTFSTERNDAMWWLMVSGDVNANRALLAVLDAPDWREDVARLVRGTLSRQQRGRWNTTVANAWGTVALARFGEAFEKTAASGHAVISVADRGIPVKVTASAQTRDIPWPTGRETLTLTHTGAGAPWAIVQSRAAIPLKAPISTGYAIKRTVTPVEQKSSGQWSRGDVYRVTLDIDSQSDMTWVVVDDPIPSGGLILGSGLGRDAASLTRGEKRQDPIAPTFIERKQDAYRAYYQYVPKGRFQIEYTVRLNNPGRFEMPATRVEALYAPEMFGEIPNAPVAVAP